MDSNIPRFAMAAAAAGACRCLATCGRPSAEIVGQSALIDR
jgi:hypothetical protein